MRLVLSLLIVLAFGCNDAELLVEPDGNGEISVAKRDEVKMIPFKGVSTWEWDGTFLAPNERCLSAGGNAGVTYAGIGNFTHLGRSAVEISQCFNFAAVPPLVYSLTMLTAATGEQLVLFEGVNAVTELRDGFDWGYEFVVESGTGRFTEVAGQGVELGTLVWNPPGAGGVFHIEGAISSVGTSQ